MTRTTRIGHAPDELLPLGEIDYVAQMRESLKPKRPTGIADEGSFRVSYEGVDGFWRDDPDSPFMYRENAPTSGTWDYRPRTLRPVRSRQMRKRIETWRENGLPVGRTVWEYRSTP
jgi:hypothetical protein